MTKINLLPWREERRKQLKRELLLQLAAAVVVAVLVLIAWGGSLSSLIDEQSGRNAYLGEEIKQLDVRIIQIQDLEKVRQRLLARKEIIEHLRANRGQMVHLFDELVKATPSSIRLTALKESESTLDLSGAAQSNASVAEYMRRIETSPWLGHAELRKTENTHGDARMPYAFTLQVVRPKSEQGGGAAGRGQPAPGMPQDKSAGGVVPDKAAIAAVGGHAP